MRGKSYLLSLLMLVLTIVPAIGQGTINNRPGGMSGSGTPESSAPVATLPSEKTLEVVGSKAPSTILYGQNLSMGGTGSTPPGGGSIGSVPLGPVPFLSLVLLCLCYFVFRFRFRISVKR